MWSILHISVTSNVVVVAPGTGQIVKNGLHVFDRGENLLQNGMLHFVFRFSQSLEITLESQNLSR